MWAWGWVASPCPPFGPALVEVGLFSPQYPTLQGKAGGVPRGPEHRWVLSIVSPHQGILYVTLCVTLAMPGRQRGGYQAGVQPWLGRGGTRVAFGGQPRARHAPGIEDEEFFFTRWQQTLRDVTLKLVAGPPWGQWMPGEGADLQPRPAGVDRVSFPLPPPL